MVFAANVLVVVSWRLQRIFCRPDFQRRPSRTGHLFRAAFL